ncbi:MAG TPA: hypothetical protein VEY12_12365 [Thermoplasmata archaeon]|nr:hypothetical protein [Thermoplasmata archaeon]
MIDPRVLHQVTVELATGFLMLAGLGVAAKLVADLWLRRLAGRNWTLDRWARKIASLAEPTSFFALAAGVFTSFATSYTGLNVWPASELWASPTVHNKMLLVALSTTLFLGAFVLRARFRGKLWSAPSTGALYALLVLAGNGFLVLQNSVGGHLQGTGSLLDDVLAMVNLNETVLWTFPTQAAIFCAVAFPLVVLVIALRVRVSNRLYAHRELAPLAREVKSLVADAKRADLGIDGPRRLIGRANAASRKGEYSRAVRLLEKAKDGLVEAHPFTGTVDEVEFWAGAETLPEGRRPALSPPGDVPATEAVPRSLSFSPPVAPTADRNTGLATLPGAMGLVEGSLRRFEEAPLLRLQEELRAARDTLLEFKVRGHDLTEPVRLLREAHGHLQRAEWHDAITCLEQFREEMRRTAAAGAPRRRDRSDAPGPSAEDL